MLKSDRDKDLTQEFQKILNKRGIIGLFGEIDNELSMGVVAALTKLDSGKNSTITMLINSPGGDPAAGIAILDTMDAIRSKIHTVILGEACSMAAVISVCGDKRSITKHSYWMAHAGSEEVEYIKTRDLKDRAQFIYRLDKILDNTVIGHTKLTKRDIEKMKNGELYMNAWECIEKGICDSIIMKSFRYPRRIVKRKKMKRR